MKVKFIILFLCSSIPLFWCTKNYILFNNFGTSTMFGASLARMAKTDYTDKEIAELINDYIISPYMLITPFRGYWTYDRLKSHINKTNKPMYNKWMAQLGTKKTGIPILDEHVYSERSTNNFNKWDFLYINEVYKSDALILIRLHFLRYAHSVLKAVKLYMQPHSDYFLIHTELDNADIENCITFYNCLINGRINDDLAYIKIIIWLTCIIYGMKVTLCKMLKAKL